MNQTIRTPLCQVTGFDAPKRAGEEIDRLEKMYQKKCHKRLNVPLFLRVEVTQRQPTCTVIAHSAPEQDVELEWLKSQMVVFV